jgi:hypothetical protein
MKQQTQYAGQVAKDFEPSKLHQDRWNRDFMLGFILAHIHRKARSNMELQRSYHELDDAYEQPSSTSSIKIVRTEYVQTVDAIMNT